MKKIFVSQNLADAILLKGFLEGHGIACIVKNEFLQNMGGQGLKWPEVWILNDQDLDKAQEIASDWDTKSSNKKERKA
jgi:hypothetical protein